MKTFSPAVCKMIHATARGALQIEKLRLTAVESKCSQKFQEVVMNKKLDPALELKAVQAANRIIDGRIREGRYTDGSHEAIEDLRDETAKMKTYYQTYG